MKPSGSHRSLLKSILSGSYTPYDLRKFINLCYRVALPLVRKKVYLGALKLQAIGMTEEDLLYDCLADLFGRDEHGHFVQIERFFEQESVAPEHSSDQLLLDTLRRIVFGVVNMNLIRLYRDTDPILAKILHNIDVAAERVQLFTKTVRFGETYFAPKEADPLLHCPPISAEYLEEQFYRVVLVHDPMPAILHKLHRILCEQTTFQRAVPLVAMALLCKKMHAVAAKEEQETPHSTAETEMEKEEIQRAVSTVCAKLQKEMHKKYVGKQKLTAEILDTYVQTVRHILVDGSSEGERSDKSFFEYLGEKLPGLTKPEYTTKHRAVLEYFVRRARWLLKEELSNL